jgi:nucleoside phosphorylase/CheY-like chemotaxis protein
MENMAVKVLVVDDNTTKIRRVLEILQSAGVRRENIDVAQTGVDARKLLSEIRYDLLILDVVLPYRSEEEPDRTGGLKLLTEISERGIFKLPLSVVGLTGFDDIHAECAELFRSHLWTLDHYEPASAGWSDRLRAKTQYIVTRSEQRDPVRHGTDICVLTALHSPELEALRVLPWNWGGPASFDEVGFYYPGTVSIEGVERSVIAAAAPRMGMVASAVLTVKMINLFHPRMLAMIGVCAGVKDQCEIGDVLVADPAWDWQMGKYSERTFSVAPDPIRIPTAVGERFIQLAEDERMLFGINSSFAGAKPRNAPAIKVGPVTSGSAVLSDGRLLQQIKKLQHRKLLGVEMEFYGMYAAARDCTPPTPVTFGLKSVCDFADGQKSDGFQPYCAFVSVMVLDAFLKRYGQDFL